MKKFIKNIQVILFFLGSFNFELAIQCAQHNRIKYACIGLTIPFIGFLAFWGGIDIASQVSENCVVRISAGIVWSIIIMLFDFMLIAFSKSKSKLLLGLRIIASLAIALIVAPPVPLMLSHAKVDAALNIEKSTQINLADSIFQAQVNEIVMPIKKASDTLNIRQQSFVEESLTGKGPHYDIKYDNFKRDSITHVKQQSIADSTVTALEKKHLATKLVMEQVSFNDYVTKVEMLFKLAITEPYIGLVFFAILTFLLIAETTALVYKNSLNNDAEDEYNLLLKKLAQNISQNVITLIDDYSINTNKQKSLVSKAEYEENIISTNEKIIELFKNKIKQSFTTEKLIADLLKGIDEKDTTNYAITKNIIEEYKKLLGSIKESPNEPKQEPPYQPITFSKN